MLYFAKHVARDSTDFVKHVVNKTVIVKLQVLFQLELYLSMNLKLKKLPSANHHHQQCLWNQLEVKGDQQIQTRQETQKRKGKKNLSISKWV